MKIYISATFRDLQTYRFAVASILRRMGHQPLGMEDYIAEGVRPLDRCLTDVSSCVGCAANKTQECNIVDSAQFL